LAIDLSPTLVDLARERLPHQLAGGRGPGSIDFRSGDMLDPALGEFDFVVGMDSLIHYEAPDAVRVLSGLAQRTREAILFTYAPSNPLLAAMHGVGKLFPRGDRAPSIVPVRGGTLHRLIAQEEALRGFMTARSVRIASGFYTSQALELARP
ncbi:MAG: magnesium protoporphyrin IX methyltransferase, partial [Comamonadaceae bacterium]